MKNVNGWTDKRLSKLITCCAAVMLVGLISPKAYAQWAGVNTQGGTGGLVIPSAHVLAWGDMALSYGNYQEAQLGEYSTQQNMSLGIGLLPHLELFGRFANYTKEPLPESIIVNGVRDLSANAKVAVPTPWSVGPHIAVGVNDLTGGAVNFKSTYVVASDSFGLLDASLGFARGNASSGRLTFNGPFGGIAWRLGDSGVAVLAEHDGQTKHAGLRWGSAPIAALGGAQLLGSLHRSIGAQTSAGLDADATRFSVTLVLPLGGREQKIANEPRGRRETLHALDAKPASTGMQPNAEDHLQSLRDALVAAGLENVRVGQGEGILGRQITVEYENHRYAHNEVDAVGIVLGLAAEMAPTGIQRLQAITLKEGLPLYATSVGVEVYRAFLRGGSAIHVRDSLAWERTPHGSTERTRWIDAEPSTASRIRLEIKPELNYTLGTEFGVFDYSMAANVQAIAPLWRGARVYTSYIKPIDHSANMEFGHIFDISLHREGLKTVALQQSLWLEDQGLATVSAGQFFFGNWGLQADAALFVPSSDDTVRLRAAAYDHAPGGIDGQGQALSASYRRMLTPSQSLEAGIQRFSDGSSGPSVEWNQWFGDVAVQLYYRRGGDLQFAGMQLSFPLTPRRGMPPGPVVVSGASQFTQGIRTLITDADHPANWVLPGAVRNFQTDTNIDVDLLNAGRLSQRYFESQLVRMRESFFEFSGEGFNGIAPASPTKSGS